MDRLEGQDIFADDFIRQEQILLESEMPSEIQNFFDGTTIFITGASGFLGKILLEKLLRTCSKLKKIYLLMRPKKGKTVEERFAEQFDCPVFEPLGKIQPNFRSKVFLVSGDLADSGKIISDEDRQMMIEEVDVIFHCAATVRFDEKMRRAVNINVRATKFFLDMAHEMKNLKVFLHVSTAYSNCPEKEIGETFYKPPYDYNKIMSLLEILDDNLLDSFTPQLLGKWPNTYAFTKTIAEDTVREYGKGLPVGILRPSIVISTSKEPIAGWINNYYGPQGVVFGAGLGLLRTLHCDPNVLADMVPVDMVINALIAFAWDIGQTKGDNPNFEKVSWKEAAPDNSPTAEKAETTEEIPILNYVSSGQNPITWGRFLDYNYKAGENQNSQYQLWYSSITLNANYYVDFVYKLVCHYLPALVIDAIAILLGKKPLLLNGYKKIHKFSKVISYFCTSQWKFQEDNVIKLWDKLSPRDRKIFNFNIQALDWESYFLLYIKGLRLYLINDNLSASVDPTRGLRLKVYHFTLVAVVNLLFLSFLWWIFSPLFA